jgi:crossover junction endodeoxyribonuclease RusA
MTGGRTWALPLPYVRPPLSANTRKHWAPAHKEYKQVRQDLDYLARYWANTENLINVGRAEVELAWYPGSQRLADADNISDTLKPVLDGLVLGGVWPDDNWRYVRRTSSLVVPRDEDPADDPRPRVILTIVEVASGDQRHGLERANGRRRARPQQRHRAHLADRPA